MVPFVLAWRRFPDRRPAMHQLREQWRQSHWTPSVDILVPTFGEPINVLERTLIGCCNQTCPIPKCGSWMTADDEKKPWPLVMTAPMCIDRSAPPKRKPEPWSASLPRKHGHLRRRFHSPDTFLENGIGFLLDPKVGLLQTPKPSSMPTP